MIFSCCGSASPSFSLCINADYYYYFLFYKGNKHPGARGGNSMKHCCTDESPRHPANRVTGSLFVTTLQICRFHKQEQNSVQTSKRPAHTESFGKFNVGLLNAGSAQTYVQIDETARNDSRIILVRLRVENHQLFVTDVQENIQPVRTSALRSRITAEFMLCS